MAKSWHRLHGVAPDLIQVAVTFVTVGEIHQVHPQSLQRRASRDQRRHRVQDTTAH